MPKLKKKLTIQFQETTWTDRRTDRQTEGQKDRQTHFIGPFLLQPGGPQGTNAVD